MNDELSRRREECLIRLSQHKEDIKRVAETGIPLLHLDTDLVSMCLHFVLAELAMIPTPPPKPQLLDDFEGGIATQMQYDYGDYKPTYYDDGPEGITSPMKYDDGNSREE